MSKVSLAIIFLILVAGVTIFISRFGTLQRVNIPANIKESTMKSSIPLDEIYSGGPGKDGIPSIDNPRFETVAEANAWVDADGLGIAVMLDGVARFYPYQILVWHEIVNDVVAGKPIVVTFCPLCGSGLVFDRTIDGQVYEFGVSGKLYQSDLLMFDRKIDGKPGTESYWAQISGEAVVGPKTGTRLEQLPTVVADWSNWKGEHPDGEVLSRDTGHRRNYSVNPYGDYDESSSIYFPVNERDSRLNPKTRVIGVEVNGTFTAYKRDDVLERTMIEDTVTGKRIVLRSTDDGGVEVLIDGQQRPHVELFWFAWVAFHPDTLLFTL